MRIRFYSATPIFINKKIPIKNLPIPINNIPNTQIISLNTDNIQNYSYPGLSKSQKLSPTNQQLHRKVPFDWLFSTKISTVSKIIKQGTIDKININKHRDNIIEVFNYSKEKKEMEAQNNSKTNSKIIIKYIKKNKSGNFLTSAQFGKPEELRERAMLFENIRKKSSKIFFNSREDELQLQNEMCENYVNDKIIARKKCNTTFQDPLDIVSDEFLNDAEKLDTKSHYLVKKIKRSFYEINPISFFTHNKNLHSNIKNNFNSNNLEYPINDPNIIKEANSQKQLASMNNSNLSPKYQQ